jgi:hypothetical protein
MSRDNKKNPGSGISPESVEVLLRDAAIREGSCPPETMEELKIVEEGLAPEQYVAPSLSELLERIRKKTPASLNVIRLENHIDQNVVGDLAMARRSQRRSATGWTPTGPKPRAKTISSIMARRTLPPERAGEIAEPAHSVADYHFPPDRWIDPEPIVRKLGITLSFGFFGDCFDGMLECRKGRFHIYCNLARVLNSTSGRARFTLGHELGHYFVDLHRIALRSGKAPSHLPSALNSTLSRSWRRRWTICLAPLDA